MELSAFAHMARCNIKVIQPGLVYVIEWHAFSLPPFPDHPLSHLHPDSTIYVAYHDWEHFSSIRNLKGPHVGRPNVREHPPPSSSSSDSPPPVSKNPRQPPKAQKLKIKLKLNASHPDVIHSPSQKTGLTFRLPPPSRSLSITPTLPLPQSSSSSSSASSFSSSFSSSLSSSSSSSSVETVPTNASPKRTFDQSELGDYHPTSARSSRLRRETIKQDISQRQGEDDNNNNDTDTTAAAAATVVDYESDGFSSLSSLDEKTTTTMSHDDLTPSVTINEPRLTRRQRKRLGLPKVRNHTQTQPRHYHHHGEEEEEAEWRRNGTGRVDVRGFRELRI